MADAEGVVGELKNRHGLDRARSRGTPLFHVQLLLGCSALNMKRLATHAGPALHAEGARSARRPCSPNYGYKSVLIDREVNPVEADPPVVRVSED
jgi:hypothetical protein